MKRYVKLLLPAFVISCMPVACSSSPKFADVINRDWNLAEVRLQNETVVFEREKLAEEGFNEIFTLRFDDERVNGVGAPNRYFAPYTVTDKQGITINTIAGTLMASIREPEKLKEHSYFGYLQNVTRWNLVKGNLELYSRGDDGTEAVLVYVPAGTGK